MSRWFNIRFPGHVCENEVIKFPDGFQHKIKKQSDVFISEKLPVLRESVEWDLRDSDPKEWSGSILRINIDLSKKMEDDQMYVVRSARCLGSLNTPQSRCLIGELADGEHRANMMGARAA